MKEERPIQRFIDINKHVRVSVLEHSSEKFEIAVQTNWYPHTNPRNWEIDYSEYPDVITVSSSMEVYGKIEEIREKYDMTKNDEWEIDDDE